MIRFSHGQMMLATLTTLGTLGSIVAHGQSVCIVDVSRPGAVVADICRGQQLEEFNHQFEGGLYAQMINNPSFEEIKNPISGIRDLMWALVNTNEFIVNH